MKNNESPPYAIVRQSENGLYSIAIKQVVNVGNTFSYVDYITGATCSTPAECQHIAISNGVKSENYFMEGLRGV